jgi:lipopolysaccharide biosynthesis regulator YciM
LNGCWCAREAYVVAGTSQQPEAIADNTRWLNLAKQELEEALADHDWDGNRNRYQYIMGEVLRQLGEFEAAIKYFEGVDRRSMLPRQLVVHQIKMAQAQQCQPDFLPPHLVEMIFLPKQAVVETAPEELEQSRLEAGAPEQRTEFVNVPTPHSIPA